VRTIFRLSVFLLALAACKQQGAAPSPASSPEAPSGPQTSQLSGGGGVVEGTITVRTPPVLPPIPTSASVARECGDALPDGSLRLGEGGSVQNAVVSVRSGPVAAPARLLPGATLDQRRCSYVPNVLAASAGATLTILNSDPLVHSVHAKEQGRPLFQFAQPLQNIPSRKPMPATPGVVEITCDLHPWMHGWVKVFDHPYFAVTDARGHFRIAPAPAGPQTIEVWQPRLGTREVQVEVPNGGTAMVDVAF
jgi:plastocyanin